MPESTDQETKKRERKPLSPAVAAERIVALERGSEDRCKAAAGRAWLAERKAVQDDVSKLIARVPEDRREDLERIVAALMPEPAAPSNGHAEPAPFADLDSGPEWLNEQPAPLQATEIDREKGTTRRVGTK